MTEAILAVDLGTSATKVLLVDRPGTIIGRHRVPHTTSHPAPDAAEQDPDEWWANLTDAARRLWEGLSDSVSVAAISVTGQMHGLVVHDDRGRAVRPAIIWQDRRSTETLPDLAKQVTSNDAASISPGYQAASWHWLAQRAPEIRATVRRLVLPKDEVIYRLIGEYVTDPSDAIGTGWFNASTGSWNAAVVEAAGGTVPMLPDVKPSGSIAGFLAARAAEALGLATGIPVVIPGGDAAVGAFGAGATDPATPLVMLSTGCQILQASDSNNIRQPWPSANPEGLPRWLNVATTLNGGNVVSWVRSTLGDASSEPSDDLIFLPYLAGERSDELAPEAAGAFIGLREHHTRKDMVWSAIDGAALAVADAFEAISSEIATDTPMLVGGGGVRDDAWLAAMARVFSRPIHVISEPDLSAWGAARSAATALGWIDPAGSPESWRPSYRTLYPAPGDTIKAVPRLRRFQDLSHRLYGKAPGRTS